MSNLFQIAKEEELSPLTVNNLHCVCPISSVMDKKLRKKFLKLENPALADMIRIVKAYE